MKALTVWERKMYEAEFVVDPIDELDEELERLINEDKDFGDYEEFCETYESERAYANAEVIDVEIIPEEDAMKTVDINRMEIRIVELLNGGMSVKDIAKKVNMKVKKVQVIVDNYRLNNPEEEVMETVNENVNVNVVEENVEETESGFFSFIGSFLGATYNGVVDAVMFVIDRTNAGLKAAATALAALGAFLGVDFGVTAVMDPTGTTAGFIAAITSWDFLLLAGGVTAVVLAAYYAGSYFATETVVANQ